MIIWTFFFYITTVFTHLLWIDFIAVSLCTFSINFWIYHFLFIYLFIFTILVFLKLNYYV